MDEPQRMSLATISDRLRYLAFDRTREINCQIVELENRWRSDFRVQLDDLRKLVSEVGANPDESGTLARWLRGLDRDGYPVEMLARKSTAPAA